MKYLLLLAFLIPLVSYAGNNDYICDVGDTPSVPDTPPVVPPPPVPTQTPAPVPTSVAQPVSSGGGGTQVWCSNETAPGYQVGVPGGGCSSQTVQNEPTPASSVHLNALPYTGLTLWEWFLQLFDLWKVGI